jgi:chromosome partitioning protein
MGHVLAVANIKGGVGKTSAAVNLAAFLATAGARCLVVDLDAQGAACRALGVVDPQAGLLEAMKWREPLDLLVRTTATPNLEVVAGGADLARADGDLLTRIGADSRLKMCMERTEGEWDWVFLDCPAGVGLVTVNALVAASSVLLPTDAQPLTLGALPEFLNTVAEIRDGLLNSSLEVSAVLPSRCNPRRKAHQRGLAELHEQFPGRVGPIIRENVALVEAPRAGQPVSSYAPRSNAASDYAAAAGWLHELLNG